MRRWVALAQPRDPAAAARWLSVLAGSAGLVTAVFAPITPGATRDTMQITAILGAVVMALAVWVRVRPNLPAWLWAGSPYIALAVMVVEDLATGDATITAQVFLAFPVLIAGMQLPRHAAMAVTAAACAAEAAVVWPELPTQQALIAFGYVTVGLLATGGVLIAAAERTDALMDQLRRQAAADPLTGLATRTVLDRAAEAALSAAAGAGAALIVLDMDGFKQINDTHGHPAGDQVLQETARLILSACRPGDVVGRLGGDELAILLPSCTVEGMLHVAGRILAAIAERPFDLADVGLVPVTVSIGAAHAPTHAAGLRGLYAAADAAMYRAKRAGKNRVAAAGVEDPAIA